MSPGKEAPKQSACNKNSFAVFGAQRVNASTKRHRLDAAAKLLQSCPTLCNPIDGSPPGSSIPGVLQARLLECVAISFSNACIHAKLLQSCPTLCDPMESSPPGSSVHRILQARILAYIMRLNKYSHGCLIVCIWGGC